MLPALLATVFFALNVTCASHSVRLLGTLRANVARLVIGTVVLGLFAHLAGTGFHGAGTFWFLLSGLVGLGIGDLGSYAALPLLGSRLTILMVQCLAAPIAALGEWLWLGTRLSASQMGLGTLILGGVAMALMPAASSAGTPRPRLLGFVYGILGACGQGIGAALLSRKGVMVAAAAGEPIATASFGMTAAYERLAAGLLFTLAWFGMLRVAGALPRGTGSGEAPGRALLWTLSNGLAGPVAGVACYQWALAIAPSGVVLPIVATAPLFSIPIAYWLEGDRPSVRSVAGGVVAVAGTVLLAWVSRH